MCFILNRGNVANSYTYSGSELEAIVDKYYLHHPQVDLKKTTIKAKFTSKDFSSFVVGETTYKEVVDAVGEPHASAGSGILRDIYLTTDKCIISIRFASQDTPTRDPWIMENITVIQLENVD